MATIKTKTSRTSLTTPALSTSLNGKCNIPNKSCHKMFFLIYLKHLDN